MHMRECVDICMCACVCGVLTEGKVAITKVIECSSIPFLCYLVQHEVNSTFPPHAPMTISRGPYYHELNPVTLSPKVKLFTL